MRFNFNRLYSSIHRERSNSFLTYSFVCLILTLSLSVSAFALLYALRIIEGDGVDRFLSSVRVFATAALAIQIPIIALFSFSQGKGDKTTEISCDDATIKKNNNNEFPLSKSEFTDISYTYEI